ncbi:YihY/virulence factor BrkB family protein [Kitasatospora paranensis]
MGPLSETGPAGPPPALPADGAPRRYGAAARRWAAVRRVAVGLWDGELTDRAAALTYYGVLAAFPATAVLLAVLLAVPGAASSTDRLPGVLDRIAPGAVGDLLRTAARQSEGHGGLGWLAVAGLLTALWSASGYVGAFVRTANAVLGVTEGRPWWKVLTLRLGLTLAPAVLLGCAALAVVVSGPTTAALGDALGLGRAVQAVWQVARWPVLAVVAVFAVAALYRVAPDAPRGGRRFVSAGSVLAVLSWLAASAGFGWFVRAVGSFDRMYGALAGVAVSLVWLWLSNVALLLGLALDAARREADGG